MATQIIPSGSVVPFKCFLCKEEVDGPAAEYVTANVVNERGQVMYAPKDFIRRHFLSASHSITLRDAIDYRPTPVVLAMGSKR